MDKKAIDRVSILVIDDNKEYRHLVCSLLYDIGYRHVFQARDAEEAIQLLQDDQFDLIICDNHMPGASGLSLISFLRGLRSNINSQIPVILLTGEARKKFVLKASGIGVDAYLVKPVCLNDLELRVRSLFEGLRPTYFAWRSAHMSEKTAEEDIVEL